MHIIKKIFLISVFTIKLFSITDTFLNSKENRYINNKQSISVYLDKDWAPKDEDEFPQIYNFLQNYLKLYEKVLKKKIIFIKNKKYKSKKEKIDITAVQGKNSIKNKAYLYSNFKVFSIFYAFAIPLHKKNPTFESLNRKKMSLAIVQRCGKLEYIRKRYPDIRLIECATNYDALKFVLQKKADYAFGNFCIFDYLVYKNFLSGLKIKLQNSDKNLITTSKYLAFSKDNRILKNIFDKAYKQIDKEEIYLLKSKWLPIPTAKKIFLTKKEKNFIKNHTIKLCTTTTWIPFNFQDIHKNIIGIGIDYWKMIAKKVNLKYKIYKAKDFTEVLNDIKTKKYDLNMATTKTLDKKSFALFTKTYEKFPIAIATKKISNFITTGVDLENKKVAVGKSYSTYYLLKSMFPKINFILTKDTKEALQLVHDNKAFAAVDIEPSLRYQIIKNGFKDIFVTGVTGVDFNLQIMVRDDYNTLVSLLNKAINSISNQERIAIYKKWMGINKEHINYTLIAEISLFFFLIILILLYFYIRQKRLKKEVENLNKTLEKRIEIAIEKERKHQLIMLQQSRLAQMGEAISMIAHQWKQPLSTLVFLNSTIIAKYKNNAITKDIMQQFEKRSSKIIFQMAQTIDNFRNFFKPEKEKAIFSLNETISESLEIISPILQEKHINITVNLNKDTKILGYKNEFGQAILNIINNSKDAFLERDIKNRKIIIEKTTKNNTVDIIIQDNAGGIDRGIISNIFEPYFTTKERSGGDGIGLYMTKLIIEKHMNGKIYIENINNGIKVKIVLETIENETRN